MWLLLLAWDVLLREHLLQDVADVLFYFQCVFVALWVVHCVGDGGQILQYVFACEEHGEQLGAKINTFGALLVLERWLLLADEVSEAGVEGVFKMTKQVVPDLELLRVVGIIVYSAPGCDDEVLQHQNILVSFLEECGAWGHRWSQRQKLLLDRRNQDLLDESLDHLRDGREVSDQLELCGVKDELQMRLNEDLQALQAWNDI